MKLIRRILSFVLFFVCSALCITGSVNVGAFAETVAMAATVQTLIAEAMAHLMPEMAETAAMAV